MKYSGIGGQAVIEGVMMRNQDRYAVAVRRPDQEIEVNIKEYKGVTRSRLKKVPIIRGVLSFIDSLVLGISTLMYSATFYDEEEEEETPRQKKRREQKEEKERQRQKAAGETVGAKASASEDTARASSESSDAESSAKAAEGPHEVKAEDKALMTVTTLISFVIAIAVFVIVPYYLSQFFSKIIDNVTIVTIIEGALRLIIFLIYILIISRMKEIQRVFMYHGAEHKCINCIEHGLDLTVENVRSSSKEHKRCGTSFLMFVVIVSIILFIFIRFDSHAARIAWRLILVPVIAGVSFEILRAAGRFDNAFINLISKPGLALQGLTTKEPDDDMIEVGIASVDAVFDWRAHVEMVRNEETHDI